MRTSFRREAKVDEGPGEPLRQPAEGARPQVAVAEAVTMQARHEAGQREQRRRSRARVVPFGLHWGHWGHWGRLRLGWCMVGGVGSCASSAAGGQHCLVRSW